MKYGFIKVSCASPILTVADCDFNGQKIIEEAINLAGKGVELAVFPELSITGYSCGELFYQETLQRSAIEALEQIAEGTQDLSMFIFVGLPLVQPDGIFDVVAALYKGDLLCVIPKAKGKSDIFTLAGSNMETRFIKVGHYEDVPFGTNIILSDAYSSRISICCEVGDDFTSPLPLSVNHTMQGATIVIAPFAMNEEVGKGEYLETILKANSGRTMSAYVASGSGRFESTSEVVFGGFKYIAENGVILKKGEVFNNESIISDIDVDRLYQDRIKKGFDINLDTASNEYITLEIEHNFDFEGDLDREVNSHPFMNVEASKVDERCKEVIEIQAHALARRLSHIHCTHAVIGLSGGLDSTLALLITCRAFDINGNDRSGITAITMPCFGTTDRTYNNACQLAKECKVELKEVVIKDSVKQHFSDIGQDESVHDITYENSQARERTQVLMDYANKINGIVIGTGDLSELALGWCTYNGDHMSMYGVNSSVPKTLVRHLVNWFSKENNSNVLRDILDTPVSPELLPPTEGNISQVTEDLVGPYELHDFFLYYVLRFGFEPSKIMYLAQQSNLSKTYSREVMLKWLKTFYRRFFTQQFKRSCMPDGAKVGSISLSPRSDWKMPSDASGAMWLKEVEKL